MLDVYRHAQAICGWSVQIEILLNMESRQGCYIYPHVSAAFLSGISFSIILSHTKDRRSYLVLSLGHTMHQQISPY